MGNWEKLINRSFNLENKERNTGLKHIPQKIKENSKKR